jgi:4-amino-4-deoxy-L-arabinose transferase-like glycosyltransferase
LSKVRSAAVWTSGDSVSARPAIRILAWLALGKFLLHLATINGYGIFRDEFYYWACGNRPAWGYVDQPPLTPLLVRLSCFLFGDSAFGIRLPAALAGAALVFLTGLMTYELGGRRWAQALAAISVIIAPIWLGLHHIMTVNAFEPLFWMGCAYVFLRIVRTGNSRLWLWFGVLAGIGLMNKHSMLFFGFSFALGLLLTEQRRFFRDPMLWMGAALAILIFLPNLIWQAANGWPQLQLLENVQHGKNYVMSAAEFFSSQVLLLNPIALPLWLAGLYFYFFTVAGKSYRALGWTYVSIIGLMILLHGKAYYPIPAYPMLLAAGAVVFSNVIEVRGWQWLKPVTVVLLLLMGAVAAPLALPVLPVEMYIRYARTINISEVKTETHEMGRLPQTHADMFGWENMAATVAEVCNRLSPEERSKAVVFAQNYGEAGALEFYGRRYGLPPVICPHNNYYLWGPGNAGDVVIVLGGNPDEARTVFERVERAATIVDPYAMPYESNLPVWVCRKLKIPMASLWPRLKRYI